MTTIAYYWKTYESFRAAVRTLLRLSGQQLERLKELTQHDFEAEVPQEWGLSNEERPYLMPLLATLYDEVRQSGFGAVMDDLLVMAREEPDLQNLDIATRRTELEDFLAPDRPGQERRQRREQAKTAGLAALYATSFSIDFRVASLEEEEIDLVPVVIARLEFDEDVGGSDAVSFQMSESGLRHLLHELNGISRKLNLLRERMPGAD